MRPRQFMGLISGAAAAAGGPQAVRAARLPDTATRDSVQKEEIDFPFVIASIPADPAAPDDSGWYRHPLECCGGCYRTVRKHTGGPS